jgi:VIT1/CCC1 family predicted Fe2+/Mn2+ transporter
MEGFSHSFLRLPWSRYCSRYLTLELQSPPNHYHSSLLKITISPLSMSLTFFKSMLFSRSSKGHYTPVSQRSSQNNMERGMSQDLDRTQVHQNEKPARTTAKTTTTTTSKVNPRTIADATIGLSDGLTVPFALTAGLSTLNDTNIVIYGGLAELIAGSISMGLGGYLGARSEAAGYRAALCETREIVAERPGRAVDLVRETFGGYGFSEAAMEDVTGKLMESEEEMVGFLMRFHHRLSMDDHTASKAVKCGLTISGGYFFGGLVPLLPYLIFASMQVAFAGSVVIMVLALFVFGWVKTALLAEKDRAVCLRNGVQMVMMGGIAAGAAMGCVKAVGGG